MVRPGEERATLVVYIYLRAFLDDCALRLAWFEKRGEEGKDTNNHLLEQKHKQELMIIVRRHMT